MANITIAHFSGKQTNLKVFKITYEKKYVPSETDLVILICEMICSRRMSSSFSITCWKSKAKMKVIFVSSTIETFLADFKSYLLIT